MPRNNASPHSKRQANASHILDTPWNTARCRRLLRPFTNKLNAVVKASKKIAPVANHSDFATVPHPGEEEGGEEEEEDDDDDFPPPQRIRRKYGRSAAARRGLLPSSPDAVQGQINVPSPWVNGSQNASDSQSPDVTPTRRRNQRLDHRNYRRHGKKDPSPSAELFRAYETLLDATEAVEGNERALSTPSRIGAPSLLQLCLKALPVTALSYQDGLEKEDPENKTGLAFEYYEHLENTLESSQGRGWDGLRLMVRAHATLLLSQSIKTGDLDESTTEELIRNVWDARFVHETKELIVAHLSRPEPVGEPYIPAQSPMSVPFGRRISCVIDLTSEEDLREFQTRQISTMLISGKLPWIWLGCHVFCKIWNKVLGAFMEQRPSPDAESFLEVTLLASCGFQITAEGKPPLNGNFAIHHHEYLSDDGWPYASCWADLSDNFTDQLLYTMSKTCSVCVVMASQECMPEEMYADRRLHIVRPFRAVWRRIWNKYKTPGTHPGLITIPALMVLLTRAVIACLRGRPYVKYLKRLNSLAIKAEAEGKPVLRWLTLLVRHIVMSSTHRSRMKKIEALDAILGIFLQENDTRKDKLVFLNKIALETAIWFQSRYSKPRYAVFCESVEARIAAAPFETTTGPEHDSVPHACKGKLSWEAGICEWITTRTPCTKKTKTLDAAVRDASRISRATQFRSSSHIDFARRLAIAAAIHQDHTDELCDSKFKPKSAGSFLFEDFLNTNDMDGDASFIPKSSSAHNNLENKALFEDLDMQTPKNKRKARGEIDNEVDELCMSTGALNRQFKSKRQKVGE